jgi:nucleoside-diphosphate-sugar epimerase
VDHLGNGIGPILLTGATGYLGTHVLAKLNARRLPCIPTSFSGDIGEPCDLTNADSVRALLGHTQPVVVIHCAAIVPENASAYDDCEAAETSIAMVKTITKNAGCPVVLASSMTVYDTSSDFPADEEGASPPAGGYASGKWMSEQVLFGRGFRGDVALRLPGLFGLPRRSGLLYNAARSFLTGGTFELAASDRIWAAVTVDDAAEYLVRAAIMPLDCPAQAVNVGYEGEFCAVSAVAEIAAHCNVKWIPPTSVNQKYFSMNLQRLESRYGMLAVNFRQRLKEFVDAVRHDLQLKSAGGLNAI